MAPQPLVVKGFALHHVEAGIGNVAGIHGVQKGRHVNARPARGVDDVGASG